MPIIKIVVPVLAIMFSFSAIANEAGDAPIRAESGLFDGMAEDVQRDLAEKHAARQANGNQTVSSVVAQPGLFDGMAEDVQRDLAEKHAARQANRNQVVPSADAQPGLFDGMAEDVRRDLAEKHAARQENRSKDN